MLRDFSSSSDIAVHKSCEFSQLVFDAGERRIKWTVHKGLRFFADGAAKKWPLRGSLKLG
jgi:hypothetical protein